MQREKIGRRGTTNAGREPYPDYKPSGVEWLGDAPAHWEVRRLKSICRFAYGDSLPSESRTDGNVPVYGSNGLVGAHYSPNTDGQCLIIGRKGSFGKIQYCSSSAFAIDTTFFVDSRYTKANIRWLYYLLAYLQLDAVSKDSAVPGLNREDAYRQIGLYPPLAEQAAIAHYLDNVTGRIRRCIDARERLIGLLEEKRRAVIHRAVTRGLDPNVRLKPSGVEWLGDVPAHWEVRRLKSICRLAYGDSLSSESRMDGDVPVYGSNGRVGVHCLPNTDGKCLVIGRKGSFGKVHYCSNSVFAIDTTFFVDRQYTNANIRWLYYLLGWLQLDSVSKDSAVPGLNREDAYQRMGVYPPLTEQAAIAAHLDKATAAIDAAVACARRQIELLREYRARLIADVVTGKLDVREATANLPDESGESVVLP